MENKIWKIDNKSEEKFLRKKTRDFDFSKFNKKQIAELISKMRKSMIAAHGIGLSANQIGLEYKVFVARVEEREGVGYKFYSVFNPVIEKLSVKKVPIEEGCLSIPGIYGQVERPEKITITGLDKNGKPIRIKAWGLLARVFQHEIDHLNGYLFIDRTKNVYKVAESPRLKEREKEVAKN